MHHKKSNLMLLRLTKTMTSSGKLSILGSRLSVLQAVVEIHMIGIFASTIFENNNTGQSLSRVTTSSPT
jgi:hypothetical protein